MTKKKFFVVALIVLFVMCFAPWTIGMAAASPTYIDIGRVNADGSNFVLFDGNLYITQNGHFVITGTTNRRRVIVEDSLTDVSITLSDVNIDTRGRGHAFRIMYDSMVNLTLAGNNELTGDGTGLSIFTGATLVITENSEGSLTATGTQSASAGIGNAGGANFIVRGGTITARGANGAGIGGSGGGSGGNITIEGGTVTAIGGSCFSGAAGIGGGQRGSAANIIITGGTVTAIGGDGSSQRQPAGQSSGGGAGIGGGGGTGSSGGRSGNITITGNANVTAIGGNAPAGAGGAGVGSGSYAAADSFGNVTIDNTGERNFQGGTGVAGRNGADVGTGGNADGPGREMM